MWRRVHAFLSPLLSSRQFEFFSLSVRTRIAVHFLLRIRFFFVQVFIRDQFDKSYFIVISSVNSTRDYHLRRLDCLTTRCIREFTRKIIFIHSGSTPTIYDYVVVIPVRRPTICNYVICDSSSSRRYATTCFVIPVRRPTISNYVVVVPARC